MDQAAFDKLSSKALKQLLNDDCNGVQDLPVEDILSICEILSRRNPRPDSSARAAWERFQACYLDPRE